MNNKLFYHNSTICLQDSSMAICGMHNFIKLIQLILNMCNVCNKNMRIYIYKQIRVSVIVSVEYKAANTNVQGKMTCLYYFHLLLTYKIDHISVMTYHRPLNLVSF